MVLPSSHPPKHGPSKSPWFNPRLSLHLPLLLFSPGIPGAFPSGDPSLLSDSLGTTDWWLCHAPLVFQPPGKLLFPTLATGFFAFAPPVTSPALPFPALPKSLPRTSLGMSWGCGRAGCDQQQWEFLPQTPQSLCSYWNLLIALAPL